MISVFSEIFHLYMPRNDQLSYGESLQRFRDCAMHEMGHILGLDDAYGTDKNGYREEMTMTANDIEMILYAYGRCIQNAKEVMQSYKGYNLDGASYSISDVIRNREDEGNGETN